MAIENQGVNDNELIGRDYRHQYLQNIGVKRIAGSDLLTLGLEPKWLYYIDDISSLAIKPDKSEFLKSVPRFMDFILNRIIKGSLQMQN